jgi:prevent-host-death family protein
MADNVQTTVIGAYDAKARFSELLERVENGQELTITRHGTPVAKLVPIKKTATPEERREAIRQWREMSKGITLGGLKIKDLINEGRP